MEQVKPQSERVKILMLDENPIQAVDRYVGMAKKLANKEKETTARNMMAKPTKCTYGVHYMYSLYANTFTKYPKVARIIERAISATSK